MNKTLGQFFTPPAVAELAAAFVYSLITPKNILDPMSGTGVLLKAIASEAHHHKSPSPHLYGIEIDSLLVEKSRAAVTNATITNSDAFTALKRFPIVDAIVGNPPYVRYQNLGKLTSLIHLSQTELNDKNLNTAVAEKIRQRVLNIVSGTSPLENAWRELVSQYPTRADLSTPAWFAVWPKLRQGGVFAFIVPKTWDSRDYGLLLEYFLLRFFDLKYVVHIGSEMSFSGAQVATDLIIATKRSTDRPVGYFLNQKLPDNLSYKEIWVRDTTEISILANSVRKATNQHKLQIRTSSLDEMRQRLLSRLGSARCNIQRTVKCVDGHENHDFSIVSSKSGWITSVIGVTDWINCEQFGININQGLRTGCNDFFYGRTNGPLDRSRYIKADVEILKSLGFDDANVEVPSSYYYPCVRYAQDLSNLVTGLYDDLPWRVLVITTNNKNNSSDIPLAIRRMIQAAKTRTVQVKGRFALIPELSALRQTPNSSRPWYCLDIRPRHKGNLFVPRINDGTVTTYLNQKRKYLIDANFSTISLPDSTKSWSMLAFMNSTATRLLIEGLGTPMGGGALKVEAVQLRRLFFPRPEHRCWQTLNQYGQLISRLNTKTIPFELQRKIDRSLFPKITNEKFTLMKMSERLQAVIRWRNNNHSMAIRNGIVPSVLPHSHDIQYKQECTVRFQGHPL